MAVRIYGNRSLKTLPGLETRPTSSRVREAVFNRWRDRVGGCRWLDLCAGIGTMGAEALARGAAAATGIEMGGRAAAIVRENWRAIARSDQRVTVLRGDAIALLTRASGKLSGPFDLIYFDPPYGSDLYDRMPGILTERRWLEIHGELAIEFDPRRWTPRDMGGLVCCRTQDYGKTSVAFYRWSDDLDPLDQ